MPHSLSAKKRLRQSETRCGRNRWRKDQIKQAIKAFEQAVHEGDKPQAAELLSVCYKKLDQIAAKGTIHKNAASRRKARLAKELGKLA